MRTANAIALTLHLDLPDDRDAVVPSALTEKMIDARQVEQRQFRARLIGTVRVQNFGMDLEWDAPVTIPGVRRQERIMLLPSGIQMHLKCQQVACGFGLLHPIKEGAMSALDLCLILRLARSSKVMGDAQTRQPRREQTRERFG